MHGVFYYSTISGNTALVAEAVQGIFSQAGITLILQDVAEDRTWQDEVDFALFGCGTYGHGQLQNTMRQCVETEWVDRMIKVPCAVIGLGDHRYDREYNMYAADILENWIRERSERLLGPALRINRSPLKLNNQKTIENWAKNFINSLRL
ncbi:flavodoxin family protein [Candidatus Gracilibacteria bacterium]|nr:flavodoxin family protein [Candidatus Gracilibacteria bacterium]